MKIVCESCGAKYSIADEKVAGKVFKIRCKKCSAVIVVKGDQQQQAEAEPSAAATDTGDAIWHVVVAGEQQGPFAPRQIGELLADGKIDWEAYVWREGMDNWLPAKDVEALVKAVMAESEGGEASASASANPPSGEVFGGSSDMGADPFASSDDGGLSGVIGSSAASAAASAGTDLFADSGHSAFAAGNDDDDRIASVASSRSAVGGTSPKVSQAESMTGQRNENSVLFSLSNLQALATGTGAPPSTASRGKPGMAQGEGSGLIDIRALASATQSMSEKPNGSSRDKVEDLLAVGATNTTFSSTALAAPVSVEKPDHSKTLLYGMGLAIGALGIAVAFLMTRDAPPQQAALTPAQEQAPAAVAAANPQATAPQAAVPAPSAPPEAKEPPAQDSQDKERADESESERTARRHRERSDRERSSEKSEKPEKSEKAEVPVAAAEPKKSSSGDKSLDDLLDTALGGGAKPKAAAPSKPAASENLPSTPSRDDVLTAMKSITPKVQACGGGQSGIAMTKVSVAGPTGKVSSADVGGQFAGTPVASCISKEVQKAKLPKFSQSSFSFSYPFKL